MRVAPADTLLGLLQRGRGKGYTRALEEPEAATELVTRCVSEDPRVDRQVEARAEFYGDLAFALHIELSALERHLFSHDDRSIQDEYRTGLTLGVLARLVRRGRTDALELLSRYVRDGWSWKWALHDLASASPEAVGTVIEPLVARVGPSALADELKRMAVRGAEDWRAVSAALDRVWDDPSLSRRNVARDREASRNSEELLEIANGFSTLRHRETAEDRELFRRTVRDGRASVTAKRNALIALGYQADDTVVDVADSFLGDVDETYGHPLPSAAWRYFMQLLKKRPVPSLRRWLDRSGPRRRLALYMLSDWGEQADLEIMRGAIQQFWTERDDYVVCDLVDGVRRLGDTQSVALVRSIFEQCEYSYLRRRAAEMLAAVDKTFPRDLAPECLWDCEGSTREVGCSTVDASSQLVAVRLAELAASELEDVHVKEAAAKRLA